MTCDIMHRNFSKKPKKQPSDSHLKKLESNLSDKHKKDNSSCNFLKSR